jgi:hypothetical protein
MPDPLPYQSPGGVNLPPGAVPIAMYRERKLDMQRNFVLLADRVIVRGRRPLQNDWETTVELTSLNPNFGRMRTRAKYFQHGLVLLAFGVTFAIFANGVAERGTGISWMVIGCIGVAVLGFILLAMALRKVTYAQFRSIYGQPVLLDVADAGPDRAEFGPFVELIQRQILIQHDLVRPNPVAKDPPGADSERGL